MFAFMGGITQGVVKGEQEMRARRREDERDERERVREARLTEQYERAKRREDKADALEREIEEAGAPLAVEDGTVYQPAKDDDGNVMPANPTEGTFKVGGQRYATMPEAKAVADRDSQSAAVRRQAAVMQRHGKTKEAIDMRALGERLEKEGHLAFIAAQRAKVPDAETIKAAGGTVPFELDPAAVQAFNAAGGDQIPQGAQGRAKVMKLPNGREIVDFAVVGPDGKLLAPSAYQIESIRGMSLADRERRDDSQFAQGKAIEHQAEVLAENKRANTIRETDSIEDRKSRERIAGMQLGAANANAAAARALDERRLVLLEDAARAESKVPPAVKLQFGALQKEADSVSSAMAKAMAEGTFDAKSDSAKRLLARQAVLTRQMSDLIAPFTMPKVDKPAKADPLDLRKEPAGGDAALGSGLQPGTAGMEEIQRRLASGKPAPASALPATMSAAAAAATPPAGAANKPGSAPPVAKMPAPADLTPSGQVPFQQFIAENITQGPSGKRAIAQRIAKDLPLLQQAINADAKLLQMEGLRPAVKAQIQQRIKANADEAEMMQGFLDGNPGV